MMLKDRVLLITNVEKFAGHGTTRVALAEGATVLAHDPTFEAPSARRKYEAEFPGATVTFPDFEATGAWRPAAAPTHHHDKGFDYRIERWRRFGP